VVRFVVLLGLLLASAAQPPVVARSIVNEPEKEAP